MMLCGLLGLDDRPKLIAALQRRGIEVTTVAGAALLIARYPSDALQVPEIGRAATIALIVGGDAQVIAALDDGFADAAVEDAADDLIAARAHALARRLRGGGALALGSLRIDALARRATRDGHELDLLPREYALLLHLARHAGEVVQRSALRLALWGRTFDPGTNVLEVHVSRLRAKLDRGFAQPMLLTERGIGYRLVVG